jgi:hypothetical protein
MTHVDVLLIVDMLGQIRSVLFGIAVTLGCLFGLGLVLFASRKK